jgi:hypothetical protein
MSDISNALRTTTSDTFVPQRRKSNAGNFRMLSLTNGFASIAARGHMKAPHDYPALHKPSRNCDNRIAEGAMRCYTAFFFVNGVNKVANSSRLAVGS